MIRLIQHDTETGTLSVYDNGLRPLSADEIAGIDEAISRPSPWWLDWGVVVAVLVAACIWLRGGGA